MDTDQIEKSCENCENECFANRYLPNGHPCENCDDNSHFVPKQNQTETEKGCYNCESVGLDKSCNVYCKLRKNGGECINYNAWTPMQTETNTNCKNTIDDFYSHIYDSDFKDYVSETLTRAKKAIKQVINRESDSAMIQIKDASETYNVNRELTMDIITLLLREYNKKIKNEQTKI